MNSYKRLISRLLVAFFIVAALPTQAFAETLNGKQAYVEPEFKETEVETKSPPNIVKEVEEKREENIKHFLLEDNTYEAVIYKDPVHYKENGKWQDIDNTLVEAKDDQGNSILENKKNDFKVKIAKKSNSEKLISINKDKYEISWKVSKVKKNYEPTNTSGTSEKTVEKEKAEGTETTNTEKSVTNIEESTTEASSNENSIAASNNEKEEEQAAKSNSTDEECPIAEVEGKVVPSTIEENNSLLGLAKSQNNDEDKKILKNINSKIKYENIENKVNLEYNVTSKKVKEAIVLNEKIDNPNFQFTLKAKNLIAKLNKDKSIGFYDNAENSKLIYTMEAPFMYDGKGEISKDIEVTLEEKGNNYVLNILPNKEWLDSSDRTYPIVIDPTVETSQDINDIHDSYVAEGVPNSNYGGVEFLQVGKGSVTGINRSYIYFDLPNISSSNIITKAYLYLWLNQSNSTPNQIDVHKVNSEWSSSSITWNNKPGFNSKIEEYAIVSGDAGGYPFQWDITSIAKEWTSTGNNYGLMLKNHNEDSGYNQFISSDSESGIANGRPTATIYYTDSTGIENYWTYHSQDVGRAGTGYVNDYNGNLVLVHNDLSMNGNRMPISINHIFNSNEKNNSIGYGLGWRLNLSQKINPIMDKGVQNYIYTDEDGTKHYLEYNSTEKVYKDETGIDITMTINSTSTTEKYVIKDKKSNQLIFTDGGYLYKIKDNNSNTITLNYDGTALKYITDGAGRLTTLDINASGYLLGIIDPSNRRTNFYYDGIKLTRITYPDGKYSTYTYDSNNNLTYATNYDGYKIQYVYYTSAPYRVNQIIETNADGSPGQGLNVKYSYNSTTYNDFRGKKNIYQFNDYGNTVSIRDDDGNALYYKYNAKNSIGEELPNKLSLESKLQKSIMNYLKNHNAEIEANWTAVNDGNTNGSSTYDTTIKYLGSKSLKTVKNDNIKRRFHKQQVTLTKGNTYTLSAYIKTDNVSNDNKKGAAAFISYQDENGNTQTVYSDYVSGTNDWERQEVTFTLPANAASDTIEANLGIVEESGTAYFDAIQLEDGSIANRYNILENPNFIYGSDTPEFWSKNPYTDTQDTLVTSYDPLYPTKLDSKKKVFKINGSALKRKSIYQKINLSGNAGDVFVVSGWAKAESVPISANRQVALDVGIEKVDGTYEWKEVPFNQDSTEWQYISAKIKAGADYKSMTFYALYYGNENTAYFDGLQLYKEEFGESYQYDDKGNLISTQDLANKKSQFEYSDNNDINKMVNINGGSFTYKYDTKHNLTEATSAENVKYTFSYDQYGNPKTSKIGDTNGLTIPSNAEYTADGNYLKSVEDSSGNKVTYNYDTTKGNLDGVTDAKGNSIFYSYDSMDRLKQVQAISSEGKLEVFPLEGSTTGTKGTRPSINNAIFAEDENGNQVLKAVDNNKSVYSLGLGLNSGTMAAWIKPGTSATTRYVLDSQLSSNASMLSLYLDTSNKLNLAVRNTDGTWRTIITSTDTATNSAWNYAAFNWSKNANNILTFNLYLNDKVYTVTNIDIATIKDFTGATTSLGMHNSGLYSINGLMDQFIYSKEALAKADIDVIRSAGRGNYLGLNTIKNSYTYENDKIKTVSHNGFSYTFNYDGADNNTEVNVGNQNLITNVFQDRTKLLLSSTYGNGHKVSYKYDSEDRISSKLINGEEKFKYSYDASGNLGILEDLINGVSYRYIYDVSDRLTKIKESNGNIINYSYDKGNNLSTFQEKVNGIGYMTSYDYDKDNRPTNIYYNNPLNNNGNMEYFPLNNSTIGSKGTKPYSETGSSFTKDLVVAAEQKGKNVLTTSESTKILYDLGIKKDQGTLGVWFNTKGGTTNRYILASEGNGSVLSLYLDSNNKLNLAVRDSAGGWVTLITSTEAVTANTWNYGAFTWNVSGTTLNAKLYINDKVYSGSTTSFKDFTGAKTAVGGTLLGTYQLNGQLEGLSSYNTALSSEEINSLYTNGRGNWVNYKYDNLGRLTDKSLNTGLSDFITKYTFEAGKLTNTTTTKVSEIDNNGKKISYSYDANGNIKTITEGGKAITYYYDELNQLTREDNEILNKTITYSYDAGGNILNKAEYPYTTGALGTPTSAISYGYGDSNWKDKLTSFNGKEITYDTIGNPLTYDGYTFTWEQGRQLAGIKGNGKDISFKYNVDGIRTEKTVNGVTTKYHLVGDKVTFEDNGTDKIYYTYDDESNLASMNLNGTEYYYVRNAQSDIIGLFDKTGAQVVSYTYDSWGKLISIDGSLKDSVGVKNPYRYRGYRYDTETGLYYLQSRYYNQEWGRFINADVVMGEVGKLLSHNMLSYCDNNPINREDHDGHSWGFVAFVISAIPIEAIIAVSLATLGVIVYLGYKACDLYSRKHVNYIDSADKITSSSSGNIKGTSSSLRSKTRKTGNPTVDVKGRKRWKRKSIPKGLEVGDKKLPSRDMIKKPIIDNNGNRVGEMHIGQPEYNYNPNGTKTPTGKIYPDHYHLSGDPMHYLP
ncbi:DNRLRE domain-containing protein [Clostridium sp. JNZ J1-5]